jgi:hypothetical protein
MDEKNALIAAATALVAKPVNQAVQNLLGPVTEKLGEKLGVLGATFGDVMCFYGNQTLERVCTEWARQRHDKPLTIEEFNRARPLFLLASFQGEDELQERWAALLESVVSCPADVLPSFGQTLSQLTTEEALFLGRIHETVIEN